MSVTTLRNLASASARSDRTTDRIMEAAQSFRVEDLPSIEMMKIDDVRQAGQKVVIRGVWNAPNGGLTHSARITVGPRSLTSQVEAYMSVSVPGGASGVDSSGTFDQKSTAVAVRKAFGALDSGVVESTPALMNAVRLAHGRFLAAAKD